MGRGGKGAHVCDLAGRVAGDPLPLARGCGGVPARKSSRCGVQACLQQQQGLLLRTGTCRANKHHVKQNASDL